MSLISNVLSCLGKKKSNDDIRVVHEDKQKRVFVTTREISMQGRVAQNTPPELVAAFQQICRNNSVIQACLLVETRQKDAGNQNTKLLVRLVLSDQSRFDSVTDHFVPVLKAFPVQADNTYLSCTVDEFDRFMPHAIYRRAEM
jgi:hypothetical protein